MGEDIRSQRKRKKKRTSFNWFFGKKKRTLQTPITDDLLERAEPGKGASEISRVTPEPVLVARGRPRMAFGSTILAHFTRGEECARTLIGGATSKGS